MNQRAPIPATERLYLRDGAPTGGSATVVAIEGDAVALDRSPFYPGGGGQPADIGVLSLDDGDSFPVTSIDVDRDGVSWHRITRDGVRTAVPLTPGLVITTIVDAPRRFVFSRYHTLLHVLNTVAMREYGGWITGAQIAADYARIDFKLEALGPAVCALLRSRVGEVISADLPVRARTIDEAEFRARPELLRTLDVSPPVADGRVRIVEIAGFDAQACGGTHVERTAAIGLFEITRTENKGRNNKRLYLKLSDG